MAKPIKTEPGVELPELFREQDAKRKMAERTAAARSTNNDMGGDFFIFIPP